MHDVNDESTPTALVTGAANRLGREIALAVAANGWDVIVHYRGSADDAAKTVADIRALGRRAQAIYADLSQPSELERLFEQASAQFALRAVINNASHFENDSPKDFAAEHLARHMGPNLSAPIELSKKLYDSLPEHARGVVINLLDQKLENLNPDFFSYTLSKSALLAATRMMAMALAPKLRVVAVSPGLTLPSYLQTQEAFDQSHRDAAMLDRSSMPADIAQAVVYLLNAKAVTGINLTVDGGQHLLGLPRDVSFLPAAQEPDATNDTDR